MDNQHPQQNLENNEVQEQAKPEWYITPEQELYLRNKLNECIMEQAMAVPQWEDVNNAIAANAFGRAKIYTIQQLLNASFTCHPTQN